MFLILNFYNYLTLTLFIEKFAAKGAKTQQILSTRVLSHDFARVISRVYKHLQKEGGRMTLVIADSLKFIHPPRHMSTECACVCVICTHGLLRQGVTSCRFRRRISLNHTRTQFSTVVSPGTQRAPDLFQRVLLSLFPRSSFALAPRIEKEVKHGRTACSLVKRLTRLQIWILCSRDYDRHKLVRAPFCELLDLTFVCAGKNFAIIVLGQ